MGLQERKSGTCQLGLPCTHAIDVLNPQVRDLCIMRESWQVCIIKSIIQKINNNNNNNSNNNSEKKGDVIKIKNSESVIYFTPLQCSS